MFEARRPPGVDRLARPHAPDWNPLIIWIFLFQRVPKSQLAIDLKDPWASFFKECQNHSQLAFRRLCKRVPGFPNYA
jgi:hypothetical protein